MYKTEFDIIIIFKVLQIAKDEIKRFFNNGFEVIGKVYLDSILHIIYSHKLFILRDKFNILKCNFYIF